MAAGSDRGPCICLHEDNVRHFLRKDGRMADCARLEEERGACKGSSRHPSGVVSQP
jgi:hypothetical protein